tara:strand:+ start:357 stop:524 length:168 start_codon:yes stop_codon:yes gene_type:complete
MKTFKQFMEKLTPVGQIVFKIGDEIVRKGETRQQYQNAVDDIMKIKNAKIKKGQV